MSLFFSFSAVSDHIFTMPSCDFFFLAQMDFYFLYDKLQQLISNRFYEANLQLTYYFKLEKYCYDISSTCTIYQSTCHNIFPWKITVIVIWIQYDKCAYILCNKRFMDFPNIPFICYIFRPCLA